MWEEGQQQSFPSVSKYPTGVVEADVVRRAGSGVKCVAIANDSASIVHRSGIIATLGSWSYLERVWADV